MAIRSNFPDIIGVGSLPALDKRKKKMKMKKKPAKKAKKKKMKY